MSAGLGGPGAEAREAEDVLPFGPLPHVCVAPGEQQPARAQGKAAAFAPGHQVGICVSWLGHLEPLRVPSSSAVGELATRAGLSTEAPPEHKYFIYKGRMLDSSLTIEEAGLANGAVLHMVLNDNLTTPSSQILVRPPSSAPGGGGGAPKQKGEGEPSSHIERELVPIRCSRHHSIEEIKELLSVLPGMPSPVSSLLA
jgi:hypothetical protein